MVGLEEPFSIRGGNGPLTYRELHFQQEPLSHQVVYWMEVLVVIK